MPPTNLVKKLGLLLSIIYEHQAPGQAQQILAILLLLLFMPRRGLVLSKGLQLVDSSPRRFDKSLRTASASSEVSSDMQDIVRALAQMSLMYVPVLLLGESGSGKDYWAAQIHQSASSIPGPLISLRSASLDSSSLEDLLSRRSNGRCGTVLLDEVADLDGAAQGALFSILSRPATQGNEHRPRLICTSRFNLEERYRAGQFREDLYFRLSGVCLRIPPLRQRREAIVDLLEHFLGQYAAELSCHKPVINASVLEWMFSYQWPGNVRELQHFARQAVLQGGIPGLPRAPSGETSPFELGPALSLKEAAREASRRAERELILKTLARTRWNRKRAAQELKISYKALLYKLKDIPTEAGQGSEGQG
jgi:two-component system response regulator AtoC